MSVEIDLSGRVVLVTGGARGIGLGIAEAFLDAGANVVTCARHDPDHPAESAGRRAQHVRTDVRDAEQVSELVRGIVEEHGRLDIVVNNAGGAPPAAVEEASPRLHSKVVELNLLAPLLVAQHAHAMMREQSSGGAIVMIGSVSGGRPSPGTAAYGAAKAGLDSLTASLAVEFAPDVRVNAVTVGMVRSPQEQAEHYGDGTTESELAAQIPLGRLATPRDVAHACLFLASPLAAYTSGAALAVDGGGEIPAFARITHAPGLPGSPDRSNGGVQ